MTFQILEGLAFILRNMDQADYYTQVSKGTDYHGTPEVTKTHAFYPSRKRMKQIIPISKKPYKQTANSASYAQTNFPHPRKKTEKPGAIRKGVATIKNGMNKLKSFVTGK